MPLITISISALHRLIIYHSLIILIILMNNSLNKGIETSEQ